MTPSVPAARRTLTLAIAIVLLVQFTLGMIVNLYITIPRSHPGAKAGNYFSGLAHGLPWAATHAAFPLALHAGLGLLAAVGTVALLLINIRSRKRSHIVTAALGAAFTVAAGFNGASFLNYGHDLSSLLMAIFFAVALAAYITSLYLD